MQAELRSEPELVAVCAALKNTALLGLWISIKEQQKLFVQKPEHKPEKAASVGAPAALSEEPPQTAKLRLTTNKTGVVL